MLALHHRELAYQCRTLLQAGYSCRQAIQYFLHFFPRANPERNLFLLEVMWGWLKVLELEEYLFYSSSRWVFGVTTPLASPFPPRRVWSRASRNISPLTNQLECWGQHIFYPARCHHASSPPKTHSLFICHSFQSVIPFIFSYWFGAHFFLPFLFYPAIPSRYFHCIK
jgi:hypothetical protein